MLYLVEVYAGPAIKIDDPNRLTKGLEKLCEVDAGSICVVMMDGNTIVERTPVKASDL